MIIITELLNSFFDEGAKVTAFNLIQSYNRKYPCEIIAINCDCELPFEITKFGLNKLLFNRRFYNRIKWSLHKEIFYIPNASITPATFVRAKLLRLYTGKEVNILSLQPVKYSFSAKIMVSAIRPTSVITQSSILAKKLERLGIKAKILLLGVDDKKFSECNKRKKIELRQKYRLDLDGKILLHVGHIKKNRNIEWLMEVKRYLPTLSILIVGSTSTNQEEEIRCALEERGIIVLGEYIPSIEEIYQLADYYVFPVENESAAIETPLSVLEAMATNLPILTTRFGSLPETFKEDEYFRFIKSPGDIVAAIKKEFPDNCNNREKILSFSWDAIADKLHGMI